MKKIITIFLSALILLAYSGSSIVSANSITSYYKTSNKITNYKEAFKLVQR